MAVDSRSTTVTAADGRALTAAVWGDPDGFPVFSLHGSPGSRFGRHYDEAAYVEAGARVITYDRPGYGGSDRLRGRSIVDCVSDVASIADALGAERFAVTGGSGGGPHSLAVAARLPGRVTRAACAAGAAPFDTPGLDWFAGMDPLNVTEFEWALEGEDVLAREYERYAAEMLERVATDPATILGDDWSLSDADRERLADRRRHVVIREMVEESFRTGVWGLVDDVLATIRPWGFDVGEIAVPTRILYGLTDVLVPRQHGEWLVANVPGAEPVVDDAGHLGDAEQVVERYTWLVQPV